MSQRSATEGGTVGAMGATSEPAGQAFWAHKMVLSAAFEGRFGALVHPIACGAPRRRLGGSRRPRGLAAASGLRRRRPGAWRGSPSRRLAAGRLAAGQLAAGRLAAGPARPASLSAASLVASPCVTNLPQLRTTSQSLTTMVVGYSLSFRPPPSSHTMTSSTRAP